MRRTFPRQWPELHAGSSLNFTCWECDGHQLLVFRYDTTESHRCRSKACKCGTSLTGEAVRQRYIAIELAGLCSDLINQHEEDLVNGRASAGWYFQDKCELEEVLCPYCVESEPCAGSEAGWSQDELLGTVQNPECVSVVCAGCHRAIAFCWEGPNRQGRIWPAECSDFVSNLGCWELERRHEIPRCQPTRWPDV